MSKLTTIVLAGGKSSRMGQNKALMNLKGKTLLENIIDLVGPYSEEVLIIGDQMNEYKKLVKGNFYEDDIKNIGPLGGLITGFRRAKNEDIFVISCDTPFFNSSALNKLLRKKEEGKNIFFVNNGRIEVLLGIYNRGFLKLMESEYSKNNLAINKIVKNFPYTTIDTEDIDSLVFMNINTREEFEKAKKEDKKR